MKRSQEPAAVPSNSSSRPFIICCAVSFLIPITVCIGFRPEAWALLLLRLPDFLCLLLWLASALGFGSAILKISGWRHTINGMLRIVTAVAIGLGLMSLTVLLIGLRFNIGLPISWGIVGVGWLAGLWAKDVWRVSFDPPMERTYRWLLLLCSAGLGLACVAALVPPGLLWGDEPNGYDVLEYHLQVPREWFELGRIVPLDHNVFSYFPFNVEMHFLLAMGLRGGPWAGMYLAQLMHVAFIALTVFAVYALVAERSKAMAVVAAVAVATVPWMGLLAPVAYDEGGLLLWGTLAIGLAFRGPGNWRSMALAGVMAGFACGSKLTAVPMVLLPVPAICVALERFKTKAAIAASAFLIVGLVIFSPWLVKNIAWVGNPIFPEGTTWLGRGHWTSTQVERWIRANHLPRVDQQNVSGRVGAGWDQVLADWRFGFVLLPLAIISVALARKERQAIALLILLLLIAIFWLFFTHLQSRFFTLAIPICGLLIGQVSPQRGKLIVYSMIVMIAGIGALTAVLIKLTSISPHLFEFIGLEKLIALTPLVETSVASDARVLLIGEGRPFLYDIPTNRLFYRTVFDVDAREGETSDAAWLGGIGKWDGPSVEVIDAPELRRFARTYWGIPQPSAEVMEMREAMIR